MKKLVYLLLSFVLLTNVFIGCVAHNPGTENTVDNSNTDSSISDINSESNVTENDALKNSNSNIITSYDENNILNSFEAEEKLLLNANILSKYLASCYNPSHSAEVPQFSYLQFLIYCAIAEEENFCYYNFFPYVYENRGDVYFKYDTVKEVLRQVFDDEVWVDNQFRQMDFSGISHTKTEEGVIHATEFGWLSACYAGDYIYSEFSADNKQIISHFEFFMPDASSDDPDSKSDGNYIIVYDIMTENDETFLRFNRFEKAE